MRIDSLKHILVTGGAGFLGLEIVKLLLEKGHKVTSLSRKKYEVLSDLGVRQIECDLSRSEDIHKLNLSGIDAIFHVAAKAGIWGSKQNYYSINLDGTKNIIQAAKMAGVKFVIYTSTPSVVFGKTDIIAGDETIAYPPQFLTHYAASKKAAEEYFISQLDDDLQGLAIRPHLIWGENDPHIIPRVVAKARAGQLKIIGDGKNKVDIIYVKNAAQAHVQAFEALIKDKQLNKKVYFIGQERPVYLWDFINQILQYHQIKPLKKKIPFGMAYIIGAILEFIYRVLPLKGEPPMTRFVALQLGKSHYFKHDRAKQDFGFHVQYTVEQALEKTFTQRD